jgi:cytoskeletal protein RodZ
MFSVFFWMLIYPSYLSQKERMKAWAILLHFRLVFLFGLFWWIEFQSKQSQEKNKKSSSKTTVRTGGTSGSRPNSKTSNDYSK